MRMIFILVLVSLVAAALFILPLRARPPIRDGGRIPVAASFYVLGEFARAVGGERVEVTTLIPAGGEPHEWEPSPRAVAEVRRAALFIYHGMGLDPWAERLAATLPRSKVLNATDGLPLPRKADGQLDPHVWLDPLLAQEMVQKIAAALNRIDPLGREQYEANKESYARQLRNLDSAYRNSLRSCRIRAVLTTHAFLDYLARRYGFQAIAIGGFSPEGEPSPARMKELVGLARKMRVRAVLTETLVSLRAAEVLAREVGAKVLRFNPLEGLTLEEEARGESYLTIMKKNLAVLREALGCEP
ncbi:MAG: zinc ABC transporter substrate-binding protein [Armatimonadota bacterium]|nr:zinc ABC transporter substrate-binding protein [Armatimonadota bacterium]